MFFKTSFKKFTFLEKKRNFFFKKQVFEIERGKKKYQMTLRKRKMATNTRSTCLADEELTDHLFLRCRVPHNLWRSILGRFDVIYLEGLFLGNVLGYLEWNEPWCLDGKFYDIASMKDKINFMVSIVPRFQGLSINLMMLDCRAVAA